MASNEKFRLRLLTSDNNTTIELADTAITIGRHSDNEISLPSDRVSGKHARVEKEGEHYYVVDLGSTNGTSVNGDRLEKEIPQQLNHNDVIQISSHEVVFEQFEGRIRRKSPRKPRPKAGNGGGGSWVPTPPVNEGDPSELPVGLSQYGYLPEYGYRLLQYMPEIYHPNLNGSYKPTPNGVDKGENPDTFIARYLGIFESILMPVEWTIDNFDLFLHAQTAPAEFLPWLASWYGMLFDSTWDEDQKREFLKEAHHLFARRGTRHSLHRMLQIYLREEPEIIEYANEDEPFHFQVKISPSHEEKSELIEAIINRFKPAHTNYELFFE